MDENIIINIGRQIGSGGRVIAKMLAEEFNCKFYDKELLDLAAKESGFSKKFFEQNDEQKGFLRSRFHLQIPLLGENNFYKSSFSDDSLYQFQSNAIRKAAEGNSCVFVGRTADYVLRDKKNIVNIFITASMNYRIQQVSKRHNCSRSEARKIIKKGESERASYYNYYTGKTWGDSTSYDLCINSDHIGLENTEKLIAEFIRQWFNIK